MSHTNAFDQVTLLFDREIQTPLALGGRRLIPGYQGELGRPLEAFLRLYAVDKANQIVGQIQTPHDLTAVVEQVATRAQALAFVQLFTAPTTYYLFTKTETLIDLVIVREGIALAEPAGYGVISADQARQLGVPIRLYVRMRDQHYTIIRNVVRATSLSGEREILRRTEQVSMTGEYALVRERRLAQVSAQAIQIPYDE